MNMRGGIQSLKRKAGVEVMYMHPCSWTVFKIIVIEQRILNFSVYCNEGENHL